MEIHQLSGRHQFRTGQGNDERLSMHRRQSEIRIWADDIFRQVIPEHAKLDGMLDIPIDIVSTAAFHQFVIKLMEYGIMFSHLAPDKTLAEAMLTLSHVTLADTLRRCGSDALDVRGFEQRREKRDHGEKEMDR
jgi:hypothetical protein